MRDPVTPGPRRKGRAAIVVAAIVVVVILAIFVGFNLQHSTEVDENTPTSPLQQDKVPAEPGQTENQ